MARYRLYKNGIYGHRYKDFYIVPDADSGDFRILTANGELFAKNVKDYDDCEWCIDLIRCNPSTRRMLEKAYKLDIGKINQIIAVLLTRKAERGFLADMNEDNLRFFQSMKRRKVKNKDFWPVESVIVPAADRERYAQFVEVLKETAEQKPD